MKPPLPYDLLLRLNSPSIRKNPTTIPMLMTGWEPKKPKKCWIDKKKLIKAPMVDFGAIFGGLTVTLLTVSRIEARERLIGSPVEVTSQ
jgi:hypothetical protein